MRIPFKFPVSLDTAVKLSQIVNTGVAVVAIVIGGWWTLHLYKAEDDGAPHLTINEIALPRHFVKGEDLDLVSITVTNSGKIPVNLQCLYVEIRQLLPFVPSKNGMPVDLDPNKSEPLSGDSALGESADWRLVKWMERKYDKGTVYLEPSEQMSFTETLGFPSGSRTIETTTEVEDFSSGDTCSRDEDGLQDSGWWSSSVTDIPQ